MPLTHLYGVFYPREAEKFGSIEINDASQIQIQERIAILKESIERMEQANLKPSNKDRIVCTEGFIKTLREEIDQLKQLVTRKEL